jgi:hypothetical protein
MKSCTSQKEKWKSHKLKVQERLQLQVYIEVVEYNWKQGK